MTSDNINVVVRAKPLLNGKPRFIPWVIENNQIYQKDDDNCPMGEIYLYDQIFDTAKKNVDIYNSAISPMVRSAIEGINLTIFAYGATSSGKTYTMNGTSRDPGVIPRIIEDIFDQINNCTHRKFLIRVSYVEIYSEIINDLLDKNNKDLKIREDIYNNVNYNPAEKVITSCQECLNIMRIGTANRTTGETQMNAFSSRSHSIFRIVIESTSTIDSEDDAAVQISQVNLIDLAGSERVSQTGATGQRFKEGAHINKSLTALGLVIKQLVERNDFINYRDSKLTRILSNSLGGNAKTLIICNINLEFVDDTASTLMFAQRAKAVKNKPKVNEIPTEASLTKKYAKECLDVKKQLNLEFEKNQQLETERTMSNKKISDLQLRIQSLEEMFVIKGPPKKPPKRRHTFGSKLSAISEDRELETVLRESTFHNFITRRASNTSEEISIINDTDSENNTTLLAPNQLLSPSTPKEHLRQRYETLNRDYKELVEFTRLEETTKSPTEECLLTRYKALKRDHEELKSYHKCSGEEIKGLKLTLKKSEQIRTDHDYMMESQKKKFEKRERELIEQINELKLKDTQEIPISNENCPILGLHANTFEIEEMNEKIECLTKQNEEAHNSNEKLKNQNTALICENESYLTKCSNLNKLIESLKLENINLKTDNNNLHLECFKIKEALNEVKQQKSADVDCLKKQNTDLQSSINQLQSELLSIKQELFESQDRLIEVTEDLDIEEKKSCQLKDQLQNELKLRVEAESKLENKSNNIFRRFSSDSVIHLQSKSLDNDVLQILYQLKHVLECQTEKNTQTNPQISRTQITNDQKEITEHISNDLEELDIDPDAVNAFCSSYLQDPEKSQTFRMFLHSFSDESSSTLKAIKENTQLNTENDLLNEIDRLKNEINMNKIERDSDNRTIFNLKTQLEEYTNVNLSDSEKLNNTCKLMNDLELLKVERERYILLVDKLQAELKNEILSRENLQQTCSSLDTQVSELILNKNLEENLEKERDDLQKSIEHSNCLLDEIEVLKTKHNDILLAFQEKESQFSKLVHEKSLLEKVNSDLDESVNQLKEACSQLKEKLETISNQFLITKTDHANLIRSSQEKETQISILISEKQQQEQEKNNLCKKIIQLEKSCSLLEEKNREFKDYNNKCLLDEIETTKSKYDSITTSVQEMKEQISNLISEKKILEKEKTDLKQEIKHLEKNSFLLEEINHKFELTTQQNKDLLDEIETIKSKNNMLTSSSDEMQVQNSKLIAEKTILEQEKTDLRETITQLEKSCSLQKEINRKFQLTTKQNEDFLDEIETIKSTNNMLMSSSQEMQTQISKLISEKKILEEENTDLRGKIIQLEKNCSIQDEINRKFQLTTKQNKDLLDEIETIKSKNNMLSSSSQQIQAQNSKLISEKKILEQEKIGLGEIIIQLEKKCSLHEEINCKFQLTTKQNKDLVDEIEAIKSKNNMLSSSSQKMQAQNSKLITEKNIIEQENSNLRETIIQLEKNSSVQEEINRKFELTTKQNKELLDEIETIRSKNNMLVSSSQKMQTQILTLISEKTILEQENTDLRKTIIHLEKNCSLQEEINRKFELTTKQNKELLDEIETIRSKNNMLMSEEVDTSQEMQTQISKLIYDKNLQEKQNTKLSQSIQASSRSEDQNKLVVEIETLKKEKTELLNELKTLKANNYQTSRLLEYKSDRVETLNSKLGHQEQRIQVLKDQLKYYKDNEKTNKQLADVEQFQIPNEANLDSDNSAKDQRISELTLSLEQATLEKNEALREVDSINTKNLEIIETLRTENMDLLTKCNNLKQEYSELENKLEQLKLLTEQVDKLKEVLNPVDLIQPTLTTKINSRKSDELRALVQIVSALIRERESLKARGNIQYLEAFNDQLKTEIKTNKKKYDILQRDYDILSEQYKIVSKQPTIAEEEINKLKPRLMGQDKPNTDISKNLKKDDNWKHRRSKAYDRRRSIDLNTLCSEDIVETCSGCRDLDLKLQKMKLDMSEQNKQLESQSSQLQELKEKYEVMKRLCRIRNEEITKLKQSKS